MYERGQDEYGIECGKFNQGGGGGVICNIRLSGVE